MKKYIVPKTTDLELKSATILASSGSGSSSGDGPDGGESTTPVTDGGAAKQAMPIPTFNFD